MVWLLTAGRNGHVGRIREVQRCACWRDVLERGAQRHRGLGRLQRSNPATSVHPVRFRAARANEPPCHNGVA